MKTYYVYILTNQPKGTLYIGVTGNLGRRMLQHHKEFFEGFSQKYCLKKLVYFEQYNSIFDALAREKQLKRWHRQWKINLIEQLNPMWHDLSRNSIDSLDPETSSG